MYFFSNLEHKIQKGACLYTYITRASKTRFNSTLDIKPQEVPVILNINAYLKLIHQIDRHLLGTKTDVSNSE